MSLRDFLLQEFDDEAIKTRATLERVPADKEDFVPHAKSMPLGRLAALIAQMPEFGAIVLTSPALEFESGRLIPLKFESPAQLVSAFGKGASKLRSALQSTSEDAWTQPWKLSMNHKPLFEASRFLAYRQMFLNHLVHHRAQLGVYLRLNSKPVPAIYGPSADETLGS
jgi:hypothetical protein